jgi:hypothetical protein
MGAGEAQTTLQGKHLKIVPDLEGWEIELKVAEGANALVQEEANVYAQRVLLAQDLTTV